MNANIITNLTALFLIILGYFIPIYSNTIITIGIFALSGSLTNWLAIYMLFDKVPFLYGSGVIPSRFEDFKKGIKELIINEFFNKKHIERFFLQNNSLSVEKISNKIDFDKIFNGLVDAILESSLGGMLSMFGGREALNPLKEPITARLKNIINDLIINKDKINDNNFTSSLIKQVEKIIDDRLIGLTPQMVKDIIQKMIRKHLNWLVVWGGFFGGFIGLIFALI